MLAYLIHCSITNQNEMLTHKSSHEMVRSLLLFFFLNVGMKLTFLVRKKFLRINILFLSSFSLIPAQSPI